MVIMTLLLKPTTLDRGDFWNLTSSERSFNLSLTDAIYEETTP
jgi:hypothetical protein